MSKEGAVQVIIEYGSDPYSFHLQKKKRLLAEILAGKPQKEVVQSVRPQTANTVGHLVGKNGQSDRPFSALSRNRHFVGSSQRPVTATQKGGET